MTFADGAGIAGREVLWFVELELDYCSNTFGVNNGTTSFCTAVNEVKCYNSRASCQDVANWNTNNGTRVYRFAPLGAHPNARLDFGKYIPALTGAPRFASSEAEPGGLGKRASVTVELFDMVAPDNIDTDPYVTDRTIAATGTWWGRFSRRHQFHKGRPLRVLEGYADLPLAEWRTRHYEIFEISGPSTDGRVVIKGKDPLKKLDGDKYRFPLPSDVELASQINRNATTIEVTHTTVAFERNNFPVYIGTELIELGVWDGDVTYTGCTRGLNDTETATHRAGDAVQNVVAWADKPVEEAIRDICLAAQIPSAYIPYAEWQTEISTYLPGQTLTGQVWRPTACQKLLNSEILPENNIALFWDELAGQIRLRVGSAFQTIAATLNEEDHILDGRVTIRAAPRRQVTTCLMWYAPLSDRAGLNPDSGHMQNIDGYQNAEAEAADKYDDTFQREFASRWFDEGDANKVGLTCKMWVDRFAETPQEMTFNIDAKDITAIRLGDVVDVYTGAYTDLRGERAPFRGQVLKERAIMPGHSYEITLLKYFPPESVTVPDTYTITGDTTNFDLWVALGGPTAPITINCIVQTGVKVSSTTTDLPAWTTGNLHPDSVVTLTREADAIIVGAGGDGGSGGAGDSAASGLPGGVAVMYTTDGAIVHDNGAESGYIGGGGGGGGAGGDDSTGGTEDIDGGGGGAGDLPGAGGAGQGTGEAGNAGTATTGGAGGNAVGVGASGGGGNLGAAGVDGQIRIEQSPDLFYTSSGGTAGAAIALSGNVVSLDTLNNVIGPIAA